MTTITAAAAPRQPQFALHSSQALKQHSSRLALSRAPVQPDAAAGGVDWDEITLRPLASQLSIAKRRSAAATCAAASAPAGSSGSDRLWPICVCATKREGRLPRLLVRRQLPPLGLLLCLLRRSKLGPGLRSLPLLLRLLLLLWWLLPRLLAHRSKAWELGGGWARLLLLLLLCLLRCGSRWARPHGRVPLIGHVVKIKVHTRRKLLLLLHRRLWLRLRLLHCWWGASGGRLIRQWRRLTSVVLLPSLLLLLGWWLGLQGTQSIRRAPEPCWLLLLLLLLSALRLPGAGSLLLAWRVRSWPGVAKLLPQLRLLRHCLWVLPARSRSRSPSGKQAAAATALLVPHAV